jgi:hypothetical protein
MQIALYPRDLFDFIIADPNLFPAAQQVTQYQDYVGDSALRMMWVVANSASVQAATTAAQKRAAKRTEFDGMRQWITASVYFDGIDDNFVQATAVPTLGPVTQMIAGSARFAEVQDALMVDEIVALAATAVFRKDWPVLRATGVVFAGYGTSEYFPHLVHYR